MKMSWFSKKRWERSALQQNIDVQTRRMRKKNIAYFKGIEINKASLSKLRVSFEHLFAGLSVLVFGNQNMVSLPFWQTYIVLL